MQTPDPRIILCLHGAGARPGEQAQQRYWRDALVAGFARDRSAQAAALANCEFRLVYYGDLSREMHDGVAYDERLDTADRDAALARLRAFDRSKRFRRVEYERLPGKSAVREFIVDIVAPVAHALGLGRQFWRRTIPDLGVYLGGGAFQTTLDERASSALEAAVDTAGGPGGLCIIAHGLGSVIAYRALHRLTQTRPGTRVHTLITLGSPLADETVKKSLPKGPLTNLVNWYNVAAEDDWMCHDETIANDYAALLEHRLISHLEDFRIYNLAVRYGKVNPHHAVGYLIHPRVVQLVGDWLDDGAEPLPDSDSDSGSD